MSEKETTRVVISQSATRKMGPTKAGCFTEMVVYKTKLGTHNNKPVYSSYTKHEMSKDQNRQSKAGRRGRE